MFDKLESRLEIEGWLTAETAFRIGAGRSTEPIGTDLPVVRDNLGQPYIPGSSFKGVLRSRVESFVRAIADDPSIVCNPINNQLWCITDERMAAKKQELIDQVRARKLAEQQRDNALTEWVKKESCLVCLTFGSPHLASCVLIRDLLVDKDLWFDQFQVRDGVAINRDTETADEGKLYDYEVVPSGVRFGLRVIVENSKPWQWGMLLAGLRAFESGDIHIGGGKSRGLGWVKLEPQKIRRFSLEGINGDARVEKLFSFLGGEGFEELSNEDISALFRDSIRDFKQELKKRAKEVGA